MVGTGLLKQRIPSKPLVAHVWRLKPAWTHCRGLQHQPRLFCRSGCLSTLVPAGGSKTRFKPHATPKRV